MVTPTRYRPSQLPAIDIFATSRRRRPWRSPSPPEGVQAVDSARTSQDEAQAEDRIIIQELRTNCAVSTGGPSFGIPVLVALAVLAGFGLLAVALDRLFVAPGVRTSETR